MEKVNDYDFFAKKRHYEITNGIKKSIKYVERPMMISMFPNLKDKNILMLGCGTGEEKLILEQYSPKKLVGIDLSKDSIEIAKESYPDCEFYVGNMLKLPFKNEEFDFIYSSLAISHIEQKDKVFEEIHRVLKPSGKLLFSVGHPLRFSSEKIEYENGTYRAIGYETKTSNIIGTYMTPTKQVNYFSDNEALEEYIQPPSTFFQQLIKAGYQVLNFKESTTIEECKDVDIDYYNRFHEIPQFMAFLAEKK